VVESSALLKRRTPKGYRGFESLPHRGFFPRKRLSKAENVAKTLRFCRGFEGAARRLAV
jgi:hypothetical protein